MNIPKLVAHIGKPITAITKSSKDTWIVPLAKEPIEDTIELSSIARIVTPLLEQRNRITNTVEPGELVEKTLNEIKEGSFRINMPIRLNLMMKSFRSGSAEQICETNAQKVDALIAQSKLPEDVSLFRGCTPYDFALPGMRTKEFIKKFYKKGRIFRIPIFPETSLRREVARRFVQKNELLADGGILLKFNCQKGTNGIYMDRLRSNKFESDINFDDEEEIMLPRNLICQFKSHTETRAYDELEVDILQTVPIFRRIHEFWNEV